MSQMEIVDALLAELGMSWETVRGKAQFPDEEQAYYHVMWDDGADHGRKRFTNMADLLTYLRESRAERQVIRPGRKVKSAAERKQRVTLLLRPATVGQLTGIAVPGETLSQTVDRFVADHSES